jgi:hypothetical protein
LAGNPLSLVLYLQSVRTDIDLQTFRLLLGLVKIVAEYSHGDDQCADDEIHNIAVDGHPCLHGLSKSSRGLYWRASDSESDNGNNEAMNVIDTKQKILDAVDANFDAQLATTKDFVAIPSTRGAEGPCQDMIGDLLRQRGYEVDDWHIDVNELKDLRRFGRL